MDDDDDNEPSLGAWNMDDDEPGLLEQMHAYDLRQRRRIRELKMENETLRKEITTWMNLALSGAQRAEVMMLRAAIAGAFTTPSKIVETPE